MSFGSYSRSSFRSAKGLAAVSNVLPFVPGVQLWLRGDEATITEASGAVSQWDDKSGNDNDAAQGTGTAQPTIDTLGGHTALAFDPANDQNLDIPGLVSLQAGTNKALSGFIVFQLTDVAAKHTLFAWGGASTAPQVRFGVDAVNAEASLSYSTVFRDDSGVTKEFYSGVGVDADPHVLAFSTDGLTLAWWLDGKLISKELDVDVGEMTPTKVLLGAWWRGSVAPNVLDGKIAEVVFTDRGFDPTDLNSLNRYAGSRYALTVDSFSPAQVDSLAFSKRMAVEEPAFDFLKIAEVAGTSEAEVRENGNILHEPDDTGQEYKTWYTGVDSATGDEKIHYAYSSDGLTWTKYPSNPLTMTRNNEDPYVVKDGSTYHMYTEDKTQGGTALRHYTSTDLTTWTDEGAISLDFGAASPVVWIEDGTWYMLYERMVPASDMHLATSSDGYTWTDSPSNPVLQPADLSWFVGPSAVVVDDIVKRGGVYYCMLHEGGSTSPAGVVTSTDLVNWTSPAGNPLQVTFHSVSNHNIQSPMLYQIKGQDVFMYNLGLDTFGAGLRIGYAVAKDA